MFNLHAADSATSNLCYVVFRTARESLLAGVHMQFYLKERCNLSSCPSGASDISRLDFLDLLPLALGIAPYDPI